jgi:transcriptional regulator with XRE-family HTH domain
MVLRDKLAQELIRYRKNAKISQEKLAELANVHRTYISQIERGLKSPTIDVVFSICNALSIKASDFIREIENGLYNQQ